jgi:signal peptidase II
MREKNESGKRRMMKRKLFLLFCGVPFLVILDQVTKHLIVTHMACGSSVPVLGDYIRLTFIYNENGAFGLRLHRLLPFLSTRLFFSFFSVLAACAVLWMYFKAKAGGRWTEIALVLILAGAAGNFIDRVRLGRVIDFIDCDFPDFIMDRFPIFNAADSCITIGVSLLILTSLLAKKDGPPAKPEG